MILFEPEEAVIERLVRWAEGQPAVRAMLLTSSRAIPGGVEDAFSDYDVILALAVDTPAGEILPFHQGRDWLEAFGRVLVLFRDPLEMEDGCQKSGYVVQFEDGLKIDFSLWETKILRRVAAAPELPAEFDAGYRLLLDKDGLAQGLKPPTYQAYIPVPPGERKYRETVEMFLLDATYMAKFLWRDDLMAARHLLETFIQQEHLLPMLEWHMEIDHGWSVKPGPYGRRLKRTLRPDLWADLEGTYTGPGLEENWQALFRTIALMRKAALEVGERLGFAYPHDIERRTLAYINQIKVYDPGG
jgi:aminoglycoside 6-adenylyltransferase